MNEDETPRRKRATVIDVARLAGVSAGTVSNAISGKRKVDGETRKRIESAIRQLGYVPNLAARRMRSGRTNTIALFSSMPGAVSAGPSRLGFLMEIAASAAITALEHNTVLALVPPVEDPVKTFQTLSMDGALLLEPASDDPVLEELVRRNVPTIVIGGNPATHGTRVAFDYAGMAEMLIDHLLAAGARRLVLVVGEQTRDTNRVFAEVYQARAAEIGMPVQILDVPEQHAETAAEAAVSEAIESGLSFDGVLVPIDAMATGVMNALRRHDFQVPDQVRVATRYDGLRARSEAPPLTSLDLHLEDAASQAIEALVPFIESGTRPGGLAVPSPGLVIRGSTQPTF